MSSVADEHSEQPLAAGKSTLDCASAGVAVSVVATDEAKPLSKNQQKKLLRQQRSAQHLRIRGHGFRSALFPWPGTNCVTKSGLLNRKLGERLEKRKPGKSAKRRSALSASA